MQQAEFIFNIFVDMAFYLNLFRKIKQVVY